MQEMERKPEVECHTIKDLFLSPLKVHLAHSHDLAQDYRLILLFYDETAFGWLCYLSKGAHGSDQHTPSGLCSHT